MFCDKKDSVSVFDGFLNSLCSVNEFHQIKQIPLKCVDHAHRFFDLRVPLYVLAESVAIAIEIESLLLWQIPSPPLLNEHETLY